MDGFAATDGNGKIVGVSFVDVHAKGSRVALLGPVAALAPGAGTKTFMAACAHAEKFGFSTLVRRDVFRGYRPKMCWYFCAEGRFCAGFCAATRDDTANDAPDFLVCRGEMHV